MLSIQDLIQKAYQPEERTIKVRIERMGGEIELRVPTSNEIKELREKHKEDYYSVFEELIYNNCINPKLNDNYLLEKFSCKDTPYRVVTTIFGNGTVDNLVNLLLDEVSKPFKIEKVKERIENVKN